MFKVHYVGDNKIPIVEWNPKSKAEDFRVFYAWCHGRGITVRASLARMDDVREDDILDLDAFRGFANQMAFREIPANASWDAKNFEEFVDTSITKPVSNEDKVIAFITSHPNCTFRQLSEAVGIKGKKELGALVNEGVDKGKIRRRKVNGNILYLPA
jgi:hypothetical protein